MRIYNLRYDDFSLSFLERNPLPYLEKFGVGTRLHDAVDKAAELRQIVLVLGSKGMGKSVRMEHVSTWFETREEKRWAIDNSYVPLRLHLVTSSRKDTYEDVLVGLLLAIDKRESTKERGRKKTPKELKERICELLAKKHIAVIGLEEAETLTKHTFDAFRDVVALSAETERRRGAKGDQVGTGLVVVGTPSSESVMRGHEEYGHRVFETVRIPDVTIAEATEVMQTWLPQATALAGEDATTFRTIVRVRICFDRPTIMRHLATVTREYARRLDRSGRLAKDATWADVPIDLKLLAAVAGDQNDPGTSNGKGPRG